MNNRIENLLPHVVILEERLNLRPSDVAEQRHRDELIRYVAIPPFLFDSYSLLASLISIEQRLQFFHGNPRSPLLTGHTQDGEHVFQPLEDLREAMLYYQVHSQPQN